jgi:Na+-driven multidrug efflux pump
MMIQSIGTPILYLGFTLLVIVLLAVDFTVLKTQGSHRVSGKEAAAWSVVWIAISLAFCAWFCWYLDGLFGRELANEKGVGIPLQSYGLAYSFLFLFSCLPLTRSQATRYEFEAVSLNGVPH